MDKCFCHLNGYAVKDATARNEIANIKETYATKEEVNNIDIPEVDLEPYATIEYVDGKTPYTTLYNNDNGTNSNITLSESITNFNYIEIYFADGNGYQAYTRMISRNGRAYLNTQNIFKTEVSEICNSALVELSDTTLSFVANYSATHTGTTIKTGDGTIKIYRVVGIK
jgi:hypothetical protein